MNIYALQTQLTDDMITQAITDKLETSQTVMTVAMAMAAVFILLLVLSTISKNNKKKKNGEKVNVAGTILILILPIIVFGGIFAVVLKANSSLQEDKEHADEWHVITSEITNLNEEEKTTTKKKKRNGRTVYEEETRTYYYASVQGFSAPEASP